MSSKINLRENIYLIGIYSQQIIGSKLPSIKQVLSVLFYNLRVVKLDVRNSARLAIQEVLLFWEKARIPTKEVKHCIAKLECLYGEWRSLQKHAGRVTESHKQKETAFVAKFNDLFDVAHANALTIMTNEEDKLFLMFQRQKDRPGCMGGIDYQYTKKERRREERENKALARKQRSITELEEAQNTVLMEATSSNSSTEYEDNIDSQEQVEVEHSDLLEIEPGSSKPKRKRGRRQIMTAKLVAAFDRCKISDRDAVHILIAAAEAFELDIDTLIINRTSVRRYREHSRKEAAETIKKLFKESDLDAIVVHWDGKLLPSATQTQLTVDRLPVIITSGDIEQLLGVPQINAGTGQQQAIAIYELLSNWSVTDKVKAVCCDTTAANTGRLNGACVMLEQILERDLLYLPCRHHIFEIILKSIFNEKINFPSTGPNVPIFKRFQESWSQIDQTKFKPGTEDLRINESLKNDLVEILDFLQCKLIEQQSREDYRELLELTVIFLGDIPPRGIFFRVPGAIHHARWMSKAIYSLKLFLFRDEFKLTAKERRDFSDICLFIVSIYVQAWFSAPIAVEAPNHDLEFLKKLIRYQTVDSVTSHVALKKFINHLWYLSPEAVAFAIFDPKVSVDTKRKIAEVISLEKTSSYDTVKRVVVETQNISEMLEKGIDNFVTAETARFFDRFKISRDFLLSDPSTWSESDSFKKGFQIASKLKVVNDTAERGVKLMEDYNNLITRNEEQKQYLLQVVKDYRRRFPDSKKETLLAIT